MSGTTLDLRRVGVVNRSQRLLETGRVVIIGPGQTETRTGLDVKVTLQGGSLYVAVDGVNVFQVEAAETIEVTARTYA